MSAYNPDRAQALADLCRFVAGCYYEPAPEFSEERLFDSMHTAAALIDPGLAKSARQLGEAFAAQDLQTLLVDYTRLFLGPGQCLASPYGSSWLPRPAETESAPHEALLDLYHSGGFDMDAEFRDLPDHVAVELEFLYLVRYTQNRAREEGDAQGLAAAQQLEQRFIAENLGLWLGPFAAAVQAGASTGFYRELGWFTERLLKHEADAL